MKTELPPESVAYRIQLSPHEWTWTQEEQEAMASAVVRMDGELSDMKRRISSYSNVMLPKVLDAYFSDSFVHNESDRNVLMEMLRFELYPEIEPTPHSKHWEVVRKMREDWTQQDWSDFYHAIDLALYRIAARH